MKRPGTLTGSEYNYLGHFRKGKYLRQGHNDVREGQRDPDRVDDKTDDFNNSATIPGTKDKMRTYIPEEIHRADYYDDTADIKASRRQDETDEINKRLRRNQK